MMSASEGGGGHGKADVVREDEFFSINQIQIQPRGKGVKNSEYLAGSSLMRSGPAENFHLDKAREEERTIA